MTEVQIKDLLSSMSLEEKLGEMTQLSRTFFESDDLGELTGPMNEIGVTPEQVALVGSTLNVFGAEKLKKIQREHMERHPHHIPMLFMADVIHGRETMYPIPLALGCSFAPELVEEVAAMAAREAAAEGIHLTFSPMADLVRDPRWGRVMESPGEDPTLNAKISAANVRGYRGEDPAAKDRMASCFKHFGGYGACEGGRDYNTVDLSDGVLREFYLRGYKGALDAGAEMVMTSFNVVDRIPATGNTKLLRKILREEWGFEGVTITDFNAMDEMIAHGFAEDGRAVAKYAITAGVDIAMNSGHYLRHMRSLIESGEVDAALVDQATLRILRLKNKLGLFENPFKGADAQKERALSLCEAHRQLARKVAAHCPVLLKNEKKALPLPSSVRLGLVGPFADSEGILGHNFPKPSDKVETFREAFISRGLSPVIAMAEELQPMQRGFTDVSDQTTQLERLTDCDVILAAVGEHPDDTGESASKTVLRLSYQQEKMLEQLHAMGKTVIAVVFSGRPMELRPVLPYCDAVLQAWFLGTEAAQAIVDVLTGKVNPSARLSISFPQTVGQIPVYYNHMNTGRPLIGTYRRFTSGYLDCPNDPLFAFGTGLSYSEFVYSDLDVQIREDGTVDVAVKVENTSAVDGRETVQLYIRDVVASCVRPVKELKDFTQVDLTAGEKKTVAFTVTKEMLSFWNNNERFVFEPGKFEIMVGHSSLDQELLKTSIEL